MCSCLDLGPSEPKTRIGWQLIYLEDEPSKLAGRWEVVKLGKQERRHECKGAPVASGNGISTPPGSGYPKSVP